VIRISATPGPSARLLAVTAAALAVVGVAGCAGNAGVPAASATKTVTAPASQAPASQAPASQAPAASSAPANGSAGSGSPAAGTDPSAAGKLPAYQPSSVLSSSPSSTVLSSPGSVTKIGEFYKDALAKDGWQVRSAVTGTYSASFTAIRGSEGVSISVYPRGGGSGISVSTHPM
jgi:hypothetical protein